MWTASTKDNYVWTWTVLHTILEGCKGVNYIKSDELELFQISSFEPFQSK